MIYGEKEYHNGCLTVLIKNERGALLWGETYYAEPEMVQVIGSGQSVTVLVNGHSCRAGRLVTQVGDNSVTTESIAY